MSRTVYGRKITSRPPSCRLSYPQHYSVLLVSCQLYNHHYHIAVTGVAAMEERSTANIPHHDSSRAGVGKTAHGVASMRAWETRRESGGLICDPYAEVLGGEIGNDWLENGFVGKEDNREDMISGLAIRTKAIDDELLHLLCEEGYVQVCVLGAGLDTRPWRLSLPDQINPNNIKWFELDFNEILEYKLNKLILAGAETNMIYRDIRTDLSLGDWSENLISSGYNKRSKTIWLLEGFTSYLTETELVLVFNIISSITADRSKLIATFLGESTKILIKEHRFKTNEPLLFVEQFGWTGTARTFSELSVEFNRPFHKNEIWNGYTIVSATFLALQQAFSTTV
jgi:methyltransferase (TIGR00027 family)